MEKVTLDELITSIRELTFDRFVIPAFAIKQTLGYSVTIVRSNFDKEGSLTIKDADGKTIVELGFSKYNTLGKLMDALIENGIVVAYTPYFIDAESSEMLLPVKDKSLGDDNVTFFRRYFFSDSEIKSMISYYYLRVLDIRTEDGDLDNDELVSKLKRPSEKHLCIWCAYHIVDKRRLYENAAKAVGTSYTDGTDYEGSGDDGTSTQTTVNIGSVFSITENATDGYFYEDFNRVGSDNIWGDRYSFWYKLMLYLRSLLEEEFGDYSLRKDNVIPGYISLTRELDFRSYYDSYPFTLSPLSRGILSKTP